VEVAGRRIGGDTTETRAFAEGDAGFVGFGQVLEFVGGVEAGVVGFGGWGEDGGEVEAEAVDALGEDFEVGIGLGEGFGMGDGGGGHVDLLEKTSPRSCGEEH